jgi:hypothetical protein
MRLQRAGQGTGSPLLGLLGAEKTTASHGYVRPGMFHRAYGNCYLTLVCVVVY